MLIAFFEKQLALNTVDKELLSQYWSEEQSLKRGEYLLQANQISHYLYFVLKGTQRIFFLDDKGIEVSVGFGYPNTLLCAAPSFLKSTPSEFSIQTLQQSKVLKISKTVFDQLKQKSPLINKCWHLFLEEALIGLIERESGMLIQDPRVRLQKLLNRSPHLFQYIPQKYIASYLRMTPETLSRIKKS